MRLCAEPHPDALLEEVEDRAPLSPEALADGEHPLDEAGALAEEFGDARHLLLVG